MLKLKSLIALIFVFQASGSYAKTSLVGKIRVTTDVGAWQEKVAAIGWELTTSHKIGATGYTECSETEEIAGAFLCQSYQAKDMNAALARASAFVEGLADITAGTLVRHDNAKLIRLMPEIGGHDLKGRDLKRFYDLIAGECAMATNKEAVCLNASEEELFRDFILPQYLRNPDFVLVTFAAFSSMDYKDVVTHEIMHAQYFLETAFRTTVDAFWEASVSAADKRLIQNRLTGVGYGVASDKLLLINEFQAYILMAGAEESHLARWVERYRPGLLAALRARGVEPVQVR